MEIAYILTWYGRTDDSSPNYDDRHHGAIRGSSTRDCASKLAALKAKHDLSKFTAIETTYILESERGEIFS